MVGKAGFAQTYQVTPAPAKPGVKADQSPAPTPAQPLGWGSNIENARLARAAELALQRGDHGLAMDYAQRAARGAPNDYHLWFLLGYAARLDGKYGVSIDAYQHGLKLSPSSVDGLSGLAQTYSLSGHTDEALRLLRQAIAIDPNRRDDLAIMGDNEMRSGNYGGAIEWLGRAERIQPTAQTELLMAVAYEHLKQFDQARHYLEMAKNRAPGNPDVDRSLAAYYRDTGDYTKAIEALLSIRNPRPDVVAELAYTYQLGGKLEDAARVYAQAATLLPRDLNLQLSTAQAQVAIGAVDQAAPFLDRASHIDPRYYRLHAIRGQIAQLQDREADAAREFLLALETLPASPVEGILYPIQLRMNVQALEKNLDEPDKANEQLRIAQTQISAIDERGPNRAVFLGLRARIKMESGQLESALSDMAESLAINPRDPNSLQMDGDLLMKMGRNEEATQVFQKVLAIDPHSRFALTALGYASRAMGKNEDAERYFKLLAHNYPSSYVPFLALGDLYTAQRRFSEAQAQYAAGYALAPQNSFMVAGGMSAAIEGHDLPLADQWRRRITDKMTDVPQILREQERYWSFMGNSSLSAELGRKAIALMPKDRDVVVYLGYDLLHLEKYDELDALTTQYKDLFPKEPDIPLLAGYVYKHNGDLERAVAEFTEALNRDPEVVTAYTNRGYVLNDLHQPAKATADFEQSLKREPKNVEAHIGLAFAQLNLHHWRNAVKQTELAEEVSGDNELVHTIRATAYGSMGMLSKSAAEYTAAIKFDPKDGSLYLGLGNIYYAQGRIRQAIQELETAESLLPQSASIYALMARSYAELQDREDATKNILLAEKYADRQPETKGRQLGEPITASDIYISTGETFSRLGDKNAALDRFSKALAMPKSSRVAVRLAIARLMADEGHATDAERQIALAQMEADAGDTAQPTGTQYIEAASVLQQMHEYAMSETYLERARSADAPDAAVRIALANTYLALGETRRASAELAAVEQTEDGEVDFRYLLAKAALYQQEHQSIEALSAFATAASIAGEDQTAQQDLLKAAGDEGYRINHKLSVLTSLTVQPIFEDSTIYVLDSKLNSPGGPVAPTDVTNLPPPRSSIETNSINAFHLHLKNLPPNGGYFQIRNARGTISVPATSSVVHRDTTDYTLNFGLDPTIHLGSNVITLNSGVQGTLRRDSLAPVQLNQNLFRVFTYASTSSFFNAVSADGFFTMEVGPFTQSPINSRALTGAINFRVGAPWSKTALVTGWGANSQTFTSAKLGNSENFNTSSYIGLNRHFSKRFSAEAIVEDLRAWRVVPFSPLHSAIAQALRPAGTITFQPSPLWNIQASSSFTSTRGFHVYDMQRNDLSVSFIRPLARTFNDKTGEIHLKYPIRFAAGIRQQSFRNFGGSQNTQIRPYISINLF